MLKIHSFLQRIKKPISRLLPGNIGKYKTQAGVIAYMLATVLFILSPDYIYGANNKPDAYAKAEIISPVVGEIVEGTANEAVIRTGQNDIGSKFLLYDLTTDGSLIGYNEQQAIRLMAAGEITYSKAQSLGNNDSDKNTNINDVKANSLQIGAAATGMVDSGSTVDKDKAETKETEKQITDGSVEEKGKETKKETTDTEKKKTEKKEKSEAKDTKKRVIDLSDSDVEILQRIVEAEATGEDVKGKILVANVILNRVKSGKFPDSVEGVVFQKDGSTYQFSPIKDNRYWSVNISQDTITAVERVIQGEDYSQGALYFSARSRADKDSMSWFDRNLEFLFKYGNHEFFK